MPIKRAVFLPALFLIVLVLASPALAHPKPGAHADVRWTIDKDAVRVECLMNLRFAEQLISWPRAARDEITPAEAELGKVGLTEYMGGPASPSSLSRALDRTNRVTIDGVVVTPNITEYRIIRPAPETRPGFVDVTQAMLPQIFIKAEYPCKAPPRRASLVWGSYPRDFLAQDRDLAPISDIDTILVAHGDIVPILFREQEPEFSWHAPAESLDSRFRPVPVPTAVPAPGFSNAPLLGGAALVIVLAALALCTRASRPRLASAFVLVSVLTAALLVTRTVQTRANKAGGGGLPTREETLAIFEPLHANIYRAFDYTQESEVYDALARSVDGPLLASVYDDIYRSLVMHEEGGALSRVKAVTTVSTAAQDATRDRASGAVSMKVLSEWRVEGVVYHWGHSHTRLNEYKAWYTVESRPAGWRIVAVEPLEQRRLDPANSGATIDDARGGSP